jgi:hypothetical protein
LFSSFQKDHFRKDEIKEKMDDLETQWMQLKVDIEGDQILFIQFLTQLVPQHPNRLLPN